MAISSAVTGVLLAAGGSTRLGQPKQLLNWQGQPLIVHTIRQLGNSGCNPIVVVLGASHLLCRQACNDCLATEHDLHSTIIWLDNYAWAEGQFSSLNLALRAIESMGDNSNPFLITLVDQPRMSSEHYRRLIAAVVTDRRKVAATQYEQGGGVPACFRHDSVRELLTLKPSAGAKAWIRQQHPEDVALFDFGESPLDIDTAEDWARLLCELNAGKS